MKYLVPAWFNVPSNAGAVLAEVSGKRNPYSRLDVRVGDVVLDAGAYVGTFAAAAMAAGALLVVCYEPHPGNFEVLRKNICHHDDRQFFVLRDAALVPGKSGAARLVLSPRGKSSSHTLMPRRGSPGEVAVLTENFNDALQNYRPTVVKVDVEGAEYGLILALSRQSSKSVREIIVEMHRLVSNQELLDKCLEKMRGLGFELVGKVWRTNRIGTEVLWRRPE